jgi:pseudoazurin
MHMFKLIAVAGLLAVTSLPAMAADFEVRMLNKGAAGAMVFEPALTKVAVGDTVTFVPVDKGHNAETIPEILPAGGETFKGDLNKPVSVTFTVAGTYGIKCGPHIGMGMAALVVVGDAPVDAVTIAAAKLPQKALERLKTIAAQGQ